MGYQKANRISRGLAVLLLLSLLVALLPSGVAGAAFKKCDKSYKVKRGDTLSSIANKFGLDATTIVKKNKLIFKSKILYAIYVGEELCIPDSINKDTGKIDDKYTMVPARYFTASRSGDTVVITTNYSNKAPTIRIGPAGKPATSYTQVKNPVVDSDHSYHFELPKKVKNTNDLTVCIRTFKKTFFWQCVSLR